MTKQNKPDCDPADEEVQHQQEVNIAAIKRLGRCFGIAAVVTTATTPAFLITYGITPPPWLVAAGSAACIAIIIGITYDFLSHTTKRGHRARRRCQNP